LPIEIDEDDDASEEEAEADGAAVGDSTLVGWSED